MNIPLGPQHVVNPGEDEDRLENPIYGISVYSTELQPVLIC